ncbi:hypothetical protein [Membranihabitans maritimus]|uniref:hypothetical protein n=1 Tax=Membranihabitans maritimus TaxID=2904244 RepID=UPI001F266E07|nr:hypothetical protein [Membranihabitans maritimus]
MAKLPTHPIILDDTYQIHLANLKKWGYIENGKVLKGTYQWKIKGEVKSSVSFVVDMSAERPYMNLAYIYRKTRKEYKIYFMAIPSNLGIGSVLYFVCPFTLKRCRKLYLIDGYFGHRTIAKNTMYECQTHSKYYRMLDHTFGSEFKIEEMYNKIYGKHFKKYYKGKITRRYQYLLDQIDKYEYRSLSSTIQLKDLDY